MHQRLLTLARVLPSALSEFRRHRLKVPHSSGGQPIDGELLAVYGMPYPAGSGGAWPSLTSIAGRCRELS